ncbi:Na+/H+ antiporter subunit B [bacterium]|nr:MAG: Na+/H+ antiporter subunit B [bacterium]RIK63933.1 MAG: Na+/H+ antiporter subunit B [Planctomycetota bacterium]
MNSLILRTTTGFLLSLLMLFSVYLMLRGHNAPGGGFIGGLTATAALTLYAFAFDVATVRKMLRLDPLSIAGLGLALALCSGLPGMVGGDAYLTSRWAVLLLPDGAEIHLGTPLLFDFGVYLVVIGVGCAVLLTMAEERGE